MPDVRPLLLAGIAALALAGCGRTDRQAPAPTESLVPLPSQQPPPPETQAPAAEPGADQCGAGKLGAYLKLAPSADTLAGIRQTVGHDRIRTIKPRDAVTMDYRPDRLNVEVGEDGKIRLLRCG